MVIGHDRVAEGYFFSTFNFSLRCFSTWCTGEPHQLGPAGGLHRGGGLHCRCSRHLLRPDGRHSGAQNIRQSTTLGFCTFSSMAREHPLLFFSMPIASVVDPDPDWILIQCGPWIRMRIRIRNPDPEPGGQK